MRALVFAFIYAPVALAANGDQSNWLIDRSSGCRIWNQAPRENESVVWSGGCRDGFAEGTGILQWFQHGRPTLRYQGELRKGKAEGHGILKRSNGDLFEGIWRDGRPEGAGRMNFHSGYSYSGVWSAGCAYDASNETFIVLGTTPEACH